MITSSFLVVTEMSFFFLIELAWLRLPWVRIDPWLRNRLSGCRDILTPELEISRVLLLFFFSGFCLSKLAVAVEHVCDLWTGTGAPCMKFSFFFGFCKFINPFVFDFCAGLKDSFCIHITILSCNVKNGFCDKNSDIVMGKQLSFIGSAHWRLSWKACWTISSSSESDSTKRRFFGGDRLSNFLGISSVF